MKHGSNEPIYVSVIIHQSLWSITNNSKRIYTLYIYTFSNFSCWNQSQVFWFWTVNSWYLKISVCLFFCYEKWSLGLTILPPTKTVVNVVRLAEQGARTPERSFYQDFVRCWNFTLIMFQYYFLMDVNCAILIHQKDVNTFYIFANKSFYVLSIISIDFALFATATASFQLHILKSCL